jgi:hypothetical protein
VQADNHRNMGRRVASAAFIGRTEELVALKTELGTDMVRGLVGPAWPELARLAPGLGRPQGGPAGPTTQSRLFELLLALLGRLAEQAPLVLVVEDLLNVEHNPTTDGPFWNAATWGFSRQ